MYNLYGSKTCGRCMAIKNTLTSRGIGFDYFILEELSSVDREEIATRAEERDILELPIIVRDNNVLTLDELIQEISNL